MDIIQKLERYIRENPNLLNNEEKNKIRKELFEYVKEPKQMIDDLLQEFFIYSGIMEPYENEFLKYIIERYPVKEFPKVLEIATGKTCSLAQKLKQNGYKVTAMDPNIRISSSDSRVKGIKLLKRRFTLDFSVLPYNIVIGYNACPVAGTLLKIKGRPTVFTICDAPETDGKLDIGVDISSKNEFIAELEKRNGSIKKVGELTIVDNSRILEINDMSYQR